MPPQFLSTLVGLDLGSLSERALGLGAWRGALLEGREPPEDWPAPEIGAPVRNTIRSLGLRRFFIGQDELVDAFLADALEAFGRRAGDLSEEIVESLRELEQLEVLRLHEEEESLAAREKRRPVVVHVPPPSEAMRAEAERDAVARLRRMTREAVEESIVAGWAEQARAWAEIADIFGDLALLLGRGWDLTQGVLRRTGWRDLLRLRELIESLPQLREVVRCLGRLESASEEDVSVAETIFGPVTRLEEEVREVRVPGVPGETRGIERSDEIARMLPSEAALLAHPVLSRLWHARRAERALLTYRFEGIELESEMVERSRQEARDVRRPKLERGPIIAVIDTSGSMHGVPEQVAKAIVLEAARTAHAERRPCLLYTYSGPGQVKEQTLELSAEGLGALLDFLGFSFGGGSDPTDVLRHVIERLQEPGWAKADVLIASDGEWPSSQAMIASVALARGRGARFHGVQIGQRGGSGLHSFCEPVHEFSEWSAIAGW